MIFTQLFEGYFFPHCLLRVGVVLYVLLYPTLTLPYIWGQRQSTFWSRGEIVKGKGDIGHFFLEWEATTSYQCFQVFFAKNQSKASCLSQITRPCNCLRIRRTISEFSASSPPMQLVRGKVLCTLSSFCSSKYEQFVLIIRLFYLKASNILLLDG